MMGYLNPSRRAMPALSTKTKSHYRELIRSVFAEKPQTYWGNHIAVRTARIVLDRHHLGKHGGEIQGVGAGVQISASLDSKWTPRDLFRDAEARNHFRKSMFCWGLFLVDLKGFEPLTSSMPFKKYQ
jgi:hypothetical protein